MYFQRISMAVLAAALCCNSLLAQEGMGAPMNPGGSVQYPMDSTAADPAMKDKIFLRKAAAGGMFEVHAGQIAAQKGNTDAVKDFG